MFRLYISIAFFLICCKKQSNKFNVDAGAFEDDIKIEQTLINEYKWKLYCAMFPDSVSLKDNKVKIINCTFGELPLYFISAINYQSQTYLDYYWYYLNSDNLFLLERFDIANGEVYSCVILDSSNVFKGFAMSSIVVHCPVNEKLNSMYLKLLKEKNLDSNSKRCLRAIFPNYNELINYLSINKTKTNPWFRKEAMKRGLLRYPYEDELGKILPDIKRSYFVYPYLYGQ